MTVIGQRTRPAPRFLVVDDAPDMRSALSRLVRSAGFEVTEACTGEECLELARAIKPDIVLLDVVLPGISGVEACRAIKDDPELTHIHIVLVSAWSKTAETQAAGRKGGADDFVYLPIPNAALLARIESAVRVMQLEASLRETEAALNEARGRLAETNGERVAPSRRQRSVPRRRSADQPPGDIHLDPTGQRYRAACHEGGGAFYLLDCVRDNQGEIVDFLLGDVNQRGAELLALTPPQAIGQRLSAMQPVLGMERFRESLTRVAKSGEPLNEEVELNLPGFRGWLHQIAIPAGNGVAFFSWDITNRKLAEVALRDSERKWCSLIESIPDYVMTLDSSGRLLFANQPHPALGVEQAVGRSIYELLSADQHPPVRDALDDVFTSGKSVRYDFESRDGKRYANDAAPLLANGTVTAAVVISRDVTERRRREEAFKASDDNFRLVAETMHDVIWFHEPGTNRLDYISPAFERIWGRSRANLSSPPMLLLEAVHVDDRERTLEAAKMGLQWNHEYRIVRPDGSIRWIRDRSFHVDDARGRKELLAGIASDITDLKIAERTARQAERLASLGTVAAGIAHEINNPMSAAWTAAEVAQATINKPNVGDMLDQCLSTIVDSLKRCDQIVQNVLRLARDERSDKLPCDLSDVVRQACQVAILSGKLLGVDVELILDENLPEVPVNALDIERAVINLVHNAIDASSPGGRVTVRAVSFPDVVRIVVQDHGQGMSDAERQHIFDPFYTNRRDGTGTGMGLPLAHKIVQEHGGRIVVQSQVHEGSTFTIELPRHRASSDGP